jgi:histidinol phosphatase-like enzyme
MASIKKLHARGGCFVLLKDINSHPHPKCAVRDPKMQMLEEAAERYIGWNRV